MSRTIGVISTFLMLVPVAYTQSAARLQFEAATVKPHTPANTPGVNERSGIDEGRGTIRIENMTLRAIIQMAYGIRGYQFSGPDWLDGARFNITAKTPEGYTRDQLRPMMQNLLAERFKLAVHREEKQVAGYVLVVAKGGPKLKPGAADRSYFTARPGLISCTRASMDELASALTGGLGRPVANRTELSGPYDLKLEWTPDAEVARGDPALAADQQWPSLFTALRDQLGLRLDTNKVTVGVIVVDHVEKTPTEN
jgi:uncharacterized protein (TIGR03435 family)